MLGFLSLPLCWVFFVFSFHVHAGAFPVLGFCCAWPPSHGGQAEVLSARLILEMAPYMLEEFVIYSVLSHHSKNLKRQTDQCYSLVTAQFKWQTHAAARLQLSLNCGPVLHQKKCRKKKREAQFWLLFLYDFSPPSEPILGKLG